MAHEVLFATNDGLTRKKWAKDLFRVLLPAVEFNDLVGTGSNAIIEMKSDLAKGEGDTIKFGIRLPLKQKGIVGSKTVEGNEEKMRFRNFYVTIEEFNLAVDTGGRMDEQRIPYNLLEEGKTGLTDRWGELLSDYVMANLAGNSSFRMGEDNEVFAMSISEPDTYHKMGVNDVAEASITAADVMDLTFLDSMKQRAETMNLYGDKYYKVRPITINGKPFYRVILHNYVFDRLRQNYNAGQWGDYVRNARTLGAPPQVEIEYNGMLISKSERVPAVYANVYRNVLLGAQAGVWAWGGAGESKSTVLAFVPYEKDAKRYVMVRGGGIFGMTKTRFESIDTNVIVGCSYATRLQP